MTSSVTGSAGGINYNFAQAPLYFVRSGSFLIREPRLEYSGAGIMLWSGAANAEQRFAYYLNTGGNGGNIAAQQHRYYGFSLRCLSTVLDI